MSGQWEVVGKKKEKGAKDLSQKVGKQSRNKPENLNVKVEDVLAKSQVKNLYSNGKNKENKPVEVKKDAGPKKAKVQDKVQEAKPKAPKSLESALNLIDSDAFKNIFEKNKTQFPDAPIVHDSVFASKPDNYPLKIVPSGVLSVIEKVAQVVDKNNLLVFYDIALTSMATDMSKNLPALGYKLFLQHIALKEPKLIRANLGKYCVLRTSYQNRPNIGLSILWAVGQAGIRDFQTGLAIFQELMLPLIELKNYSRFIVQYLIKLISGADQATVSKEQFVSLLDVVFSSKKNFPSDLKQDLVTVVPTLKSFLATSKEPTCVDFYLKKIPTVGNDSFKDCLCDVIVDGFNRDQSSLESWGKNYTKNWQTLSCKINKKVLAHTLNQILLESNELRTRKKKDEGLIEAIRVSEELLGKMANKKSSRSWFKFLFYTTTLLLAIYIYADTKQAGSWQKSNTRKFLVETGVYDYTHKAVGKVQEGWLVVDNKIKENFPTYRQAVIEFSEPYIEFFNSFGQILCNLFANIKEAVIEKYPVVVKSIDSYAPGVVEQSQNAVSTAWSSSVFYVNRSIDYLRTEVFVGQLSPENMQRVVYEAFNTTQTKATEYYHWLYEKVQNTIK
ncbi:Transmembrane protein 214-B-like Protein [Tribolium castaneum]|uniref:Transmembrane protein 214-B-like Protein n=1 Tax=Tribolium castaneum TaxID=7070 RepID=A0A139WG18_TRICA|nr:Transmembrane protein 214-B-like Protein [Tribolium castaneum]